MKKWLLLILLAFVLTSILAISYTNQVISAFTNFDEDDGNGEEDNSVEISILKFQITTVEPLDPNGFIPIYDLSLSLGIILVLILFLEIKYLNISRLKIHLNSLGVIQNNSLNRTY